MNFQGVRAGFEIAQRQIEGSGFARCEVMGQNHDGLFELLKRFAPAAEQIAQYGLFDVDQIGGTRAERRMLQAFEGLDVAAHHTTDSVVALAWLLAQPTIVAPIASARTVAQLSELLPIADVRLTDEEVARLSAASVVRR